MRNLPKTYIHNKPILKSYGFDRDTLLKSILYVYKVLDAIDDKLTEADTVRFSKLVELANLSAMIGNLFRSGLIRHSDGMFKENAPHAFPDLLSVDETYDDLEIKVALETNKPKGHLIKPGHHIVIRYVLGENDGSYNRGKENRGDVAWIWEVAIGELIEEHFSVSNTAGDSGKTAVINKAGMNNLNTVFFDPRMFPYGNKGPVKKAYSIFF